MGSLRGLLECGPGDVIGLAAPLSFDPAMLDIWLAVRSKAGITLIPSRVKGFPPSCHAYSLTASVLVFEADPAELRRCLVTKPSRPTILQVRPDLCLPLLDLIFFFSQITPTLLASLGSDFLRDELLAPSVPPSPPSGPLQRGPALQSGLRWLLVGGEAFPAALLSVRPPDSPVRIANLYGITELSVWASAALLAPGKGYNSAKKPIKCVMGKMIAGIATWGRPSP